MKRMLFCMMLSVSTLSLTSTSAWAGRVAVLPTIYEDASSGTIDANASADFHTAVLEGVQTAGFNVLSNEELASVAEQNISTGVCDETCLLAVQRNLGTDDALQVRVREDREMSVRVISVRFAVRDRITRDSSDGYAVVKTWLKGAVALALKDRVPHIAEAAVPEMTKPDVAMAIKEKEGDTTVPFLKDAPRKKLGPRPLVVAGTTTLLLGIGTVVMDQIAHRNFETISTNLEDTSVYTSPAYKEDINTLETEQLITKILLGATAAGLLTSCVLAIFTDFSKFKNKNEEINASVAIGDNTGTLFIGGSF